MFQAPTLMRRSDARSMLVNSAAVSAQGYREALATAKGGRKTAHAKGAVFPNGSGKIVINGKVQST